MAFVLSLLFLLQLDSQVMIKDLKFNVPDGFELTRPFQSQNVVTLSETGIDRHHYGHQKISPRYWPEITILAIDKENQRFNQRIEEKVRDSNPKISSVFVDNQKAEKRIVNINFGEFWIHGIIVQTEYKGITYKFILALNHGEPKQKEYEKIFEKLISEAKFSP